MFKLGYKARVYPGLSTYNCLIMQQSTLLLRFADKLTRHFDEFRVHKKVLPDGSATVVIAAVRRLDTTIYLRHRLWLVCRYYPDLLTVYIES